MSALMVMMNERNALPLALAQPLQPLLRTLLSVQLQWPGGSSVVIRPLDDEVNLCTCGCREDRVCGLQLVEAAARLGRAMGGIPPCCIQLGYPLGALAHPPFLLHDLHQLATALVVAASPSSCSTGASVCYGPAADPLLCLDISPAELADYHAVALLAADALIAESGQLVSSLVPLVAAGRQPLAAVPPLVDQAIAAALVDYPDQ